MVAISKREKYIGIGVGAAVGLLLLDQVVLNPFKDRLDTIAVQTDDARQKVSDAANLMGREHRLQRVWKDMEAGGLMADENQAESQALHAVLKWAQNSGVNLAALKPERTQTQGQFQVISFHITGTGSTPAIARLLWGMESATIPVRLNDMQISPVKEGTDALTVQLSVSTLCMLSADSKSTTPVAVAN